MGDSPANSFGWTDATPAAGSSNKLAASDSAWLQYRVLPDGTVRLRGSAVRDSGKWSNNEVIATLPLGLFPVDRAQIFYYADFLLIYFNGELTYVGPGATFDTMYFDGLSWMKD